jgi:hypothetical protein
MGGDLAPSAGAARSGLPGPTPTVREVEDGLSSVYVLERMIEATPSPRPVRPVLVRASGKLLRVPWDEIPAPRRVQAHVTVEAGTLEREALGAPARWISAVLHEGRQHRCGVAVPT